jgi:hypothetical protein
MSSEQWAERVDGELTAAIDLRLGQKAVILENLKINIQQLSESLFESARSQVGTRSSCSAETRKFANRN